jgi:hypothetical protein
MKASLILFGSLISFTSAYAGAVSSGGTGQNLEACFKKSQQIRFFVSVEDNSHLVAKIFRKSTLIAQSVVHRVEDGYEGDFIKAQIEYSGNGKYANVMILPADPQEEPRVYVNLQCSENVR